MSCGTSVCQKCFDSECDDAHVVQLDLDGSLAEDDVLTGIGLSNPNGPSDPDEWFPYPTKTVSIL